MTWSPAEAKRWRARLGKELAASQLADYRARLQALRDAAREARERRAKELAVARQACDAGYLAVKERADEAWRQAVQLATEARRAKKQAHLERCRADREAIKAEAAAAIDAKRQEAEAERAFRAEMNRLARAQPRVRSTARERRAESDDEVRANIEPALLPLFERVRRTIRGSDRRTRTEEFLEYVEEHPDELIAARERHAEAEFRREQREQARALRRSAVPF